MPIKHLGLSNHNSYSFKKIDLLFRYRKKLMVWPATFESQTYSKKHSSFLDSVCPDTSIHIRHIHLILEHVPAF